MRKRIDGRSIHFLGHIGASVLFGKHAGNMQSNPRRHSNGNPGSFNRHDARNPLAFIQTCDLLSDLHNEIGIHLLIEETADFKDIARQNGPFRQNFFFQRLHLCSL